MISHLFIKHLVIVCMFACNILVVVANQMVRLLHLLQRRLPYTIVRYLVGNTEPNKGYTRCIEI